MKMEILVSGIFLFLLVIGSVSAQDNAQIQRDLTLNLRELIEPPDPDQYPEPEIPAGGADPPLITDDWDDWPDCPANLSLIINPFPELSHCVVRDDLTLIEGSYQMHGIFVIANNSFLDCNNSTLYGYLPSPNPLTTAIHVYGSNNTVKNCNIMNHTFGVLAGKPILNDPFTNNTVIYNNFKNNLVAGVLTLADYNNISFNNFSSDGSGTYVHMKYGVATNHPWAGWIIFPVKNLIISHNNIDNMEETGMFINKVESAEILNNVITNSRGNTTHGIKIEDSYNLTMKYNEISDMNNIGSIGIYFYEQGGPLPYSTRNIDISHNIIRGNSGGIEIFGTSIKIYNNTIEDNYQNSLCCMGILTWRLDDFNISNNRFYGNGGAGLYVYHSYYESPWGPYRGSITSNDFQDNTNGIYIYVSSGVTINNNNFDDSVDMSINLWGKGNNRVYDNTFYGGGWHDVGIYSSSGNKVYDNIGSFGNDGVFIRQYETGLPPNNNEVYGNTLSNYGDCGIYLYDTTNSANNLVFSNTITNNYGGVCIGYDSDGWEFYLNNVYSNTVNVASLLPGVPAELSYIGYGNYWGHSSPPCFCEYGNPDPNCINNWDSIYSDVIDSHPFCSVVNRDFINIPLEQGWNFVSFNVMPDDTDTETVLMSIDGYYDFVYNYVNGDGNYYDPDIPWSPLTDLYPWYGYWIHMANESPNYLTVIGDEITDCNPLYLQAGSNPNHLVGYWLDYASDVDDALASFWSTPLDRWNYDYVKGYDDGWKTYDPDLPQFSDLDVMEPGMAYFVKMDYEDELDYICPVMCDDDDCPPGQGCDWRDRCTWNCLLHEDFRCMTSCSSGYIEYSGPGYECPAGDVCCGPDDI